MAPVAMADAAALNAWWLRFDDPTLTSLIEVSLHANTSIRSAEAVLHEAQAAREVASAALWPLLTGAISVQRSRTGHQDAQDNWQAGLEASWAADLFGVNRSAVRASVAALEASAATLGDAQVAVTAEVALDYILLRSAQARRAIAADSLASQQDTLQIAAWREQAGLATGLDTEQARAAAEQTAALTPALDASIGQARHALALLTGQAPAALDAMLATAASIPVASDELAIGIPADTLRQRPDVRAAERQVVAALARVSQAEAARWPGFSLGGTLGVSAASVSALTGTAAVATSLLARASLPLFDGGAARAQLHVQQAALLQSRAAYDAVVLGALRDVEDALLALRSDRQRLASLGNATAAARNAAAMARKQYSSGLVDFQTVLQTQRTELSAQDGQSVAAANVSSDQVRLYQALGGGWQGDKAATSLMSRRP